MANDSTAAGYLSPVGKLPDYDGELERQIVRWIAGVSGLPATMIFRRFSDPQQKIPASGKTWCAFSFNTISMPGTPANVQISDDQSEQWTWEGVSVLCCFYGPSGSGAATTFREGIHIEQNGDALRTASGMSLIEAATVISVPELINNQWVRRYDVAITLSRKNIRTFNIKSIVTPNVTVLKGN